MNLRVHAEGRTGVIPALQTVLAVLNASHGNCGLQGESHGVGPRDDKIELKGLEGW